jgi:ribonuclease R
MADGLTFSGVTLDGPYTKDIDDAFDLVYADGKWTLTVSIADVARTIHAGTELDTRAYERTATRYFAAGNSPMIPRAFSEDKCSLWPHKPKKVMAVELTFDENGRRLDWKIHRQAKLTSRAKLAYDMVPGILADVDHEHHVLFQGARKLAFKLLERRRQAGAMVLYDLNNGWITTEDGYLKKIEKHEETVGQIIIQEFMIATNASVAEWCVQNDVPVLFRNHNARAAAPPREDLMQQMQDAFSTPLPNLDLVRQRVHMLMDRADYGPILLGHYGLNVPAYLHFTSPIRRYADLVNQRQIDAFIAGDELPYTALRLNELAVHINTVEKQERDKRSLNLKERQDNRARQAGSDARRLHGLNAKEFERVVKVQTRSGEPPTEALQEAYANRLLDRTMPIVCLTVGYLFPPLDDAWRPLRESILAYLVRVPSDAISMVMQAAQICGWPEFEYEGSRTGADHAPVFTARARVRFPSAVAEGPLPKNAEASAQGTSAKDAKAKATIALLAAIYDLPRPELGNIPVPPPPPVKKPPDPNKDPISVLHEICQTRGIPLPDYTFASEGPPHKVTFTCTCKIDGISKQGKSHSKQESKRLAVKEVLSALA